MAFTSKADFVEGNDAVQAFKPTSGGGTTVTNPVTTGGGTTATATTTTPAAADPPPTITDQDGDGIPDTALSDQNTGKVTADEPEEPATDVAVDTTITEG